MTGGEIDAHIDSLRELWLTDSDLAFLRRLEPELLGRIVGEVRAHGERVHAGQRAMYEALARASRFIPNFLLSKFSGGLGAYVLARITEHLEPKTAASLSRSYEPALLAEISLHLQAGMVASIAAHTSVDTLLEITDLLAKKGLSRRLGEISDTLEESLLAKLVERMRDPERIAAIAAHMHALDKLQRVARRLDVSRREAVATALSARGHAQAAAVLTALRA
ncbi:MAG TPA: hypothetical protein VG963_34285 [Polyangiaceae bacterium]|nr:hypothetical protein [Polyangiaceae bacterium]